MNHANRRSAAIVVLLAFSATLLANHAPLPEKLVQARTAYIDVSDARARDALYTALTKWGRFTLVDHAQDAQIFFRLAGKSRVADVNSYGQVDRDVEMTLTVFDPSDKMDLWSASRTAGTFGARVPTASLVGDLRKSIQRQGSAK